MGGFGFHNLAVGRYEYRSHQTKRTKTLGNGVRLHVAVVVFASPHKIAVPFQGRSHHVVNQAVFVNNAFFGEFGFIIAVENFFKNILKPTIVFLQDGVFGRKIQRPAFVQSHVETRMSKTTNRLVGVVHGHGNAVAFEIINLKFLNRSVFAFKLHGQFTFAFGYEIGGAVLVAKSVAAHHNRGCPVRHQARNVFANNGFAENRSVQNIANGAVGRLPHLL